MSKFTTVNKNGFTPFVNGGNQSLLQSTRMGSNPLLIVDVKVYYSQPEKGSNPLLIVDVKVYYSQQECISTFAESIYVCKSSINAFLKMF